MAFKLVALFRSSKTGGGTAVNSDERQIEFLKSLSGVERVKVGKVTGGPGGESNFSRIVEIYFKDQASAQAALTSQDVRAETKKMFAGGSKAKLLYVEEE